MEFNLIREDSSTKCNEQIYNTSILFKPKISFKKTQGKYYWNTKCVDHTQEVINPISIKFKNYVWKSFQDEIMLIINVK